MYCVENFTIENKDIKTRHSLTNTFKSSTAVYSYQSSSINQLSLSSKTNYVTQHSNYLPISLLSVFAKFMETNTFLYFNKLIIIIVISVKRFFI